jgi:transposase
MRSRSLRMVAAKVCIPAAARPRQQCMGKRILVGRVGDRHDILAGTPLVLFVAECTRIIARLRWHLHELDPGWTPPANIDRVSAFDTVTAHLGACSNNALVCRLALRLVEHLRLLTVEIDELTTEITERIITIAPSLLAIVGCGALTAAKIVGETRPRRPVPFQRRLRPAQRHRTTAGLVVKQTATSLVTHRQSPAQRRPAPHRVNPDANAPTRS